MAPWLLLSVESSLEAGIVPRRSQDGELCCSKWGTFNMLPHFLNAFGMRRKTFLRLAPALRRKSARSDRSSNDKR